MPHPAGTTLETEETELAEASLLLLQCVSKRSRSQSVEQTRSWKEVL